MALPKVADRVHAAAADARAQGANKGGRRHPWAVLRPPAALRVRRLPAQGQLPVSRGLRRPREAEPGDHLPALSLQDKVPAKLLRTEGQPRVRVDKPHIRLLRRVQAAVQRGALEGVHLVL